MQVKLALVHLAPLQLERHVLNPKLLHRVVRKL
jgi:hypothetical protein